jgi:hypothetical protein
MKLMVVMGEYPPEEDERRRQAVLKCASPGTEIGFGVIKATFFRRSNSQVNSLSAGPLVAEIAQKRKPTATMPCCHSALWMPELSWREIWSAFPS